MKMKKKRSPPPELFPTNVPMLSQNISKPKEYNFKMLYNQAMREEALKNPVRQLTRSLNKPQPLNISTFNSQSRLLMPRFVTEQFNIDKKIKEIRRITKENGLDIQRKDSNIAFSKDKINMVFESTRLLKEIEKRKTNSLNDESGSVSTFLADNKEIAIKNLLIKLLKTESTKLKNNEEDINVTLSDGSSNLKNQKEMFNDLIEKQKVLCKEIENALIDVQKSNLDLAETEKACKVSYKLMEDEVEKYLELINNKRLWANFIHHVMKQDESRFSKDILLIDKDIESGTPRIQQKPNYEQLARSVVNDYSFCLEQRIDQLYILQDPSAMIEKFSQYEEHILKCLDFKRELLDNSKMKSDEGARVLTELAKREESLAFEEQELKEKISRLSNDIKLWKSNQLNPDVDLQLLIRDLNNTICNKDVLSRAKGKMKSIQEVAEESIEGLKDIEMKINEQLRTLTVYENDMCSFYQIINQRKNQNKESKQNAAKLYLEHVQNMKRKKAEDKFNRIVIQSRKTEPPYYYSKKTNEKLTLNTNQNQEDENDDLLNYN